MSKVNRTLHAQQSILHQLKPSSNTALDYVRRTLNEKLQQTKGVSDTQKSLVKIVMSVLESISASDGTPTLDKRISAFLAEINEIENVADEMISGALAQVHEYSEELKALNEQPGTTAPANFDEIDAEITRRVEWITQVTEFQEPLEDEVDKKKIEIRRLNQTINFDSPSNPAELKKNKADLEKAVSLTEKTIELIMQQRAVIEQEIHELQAFKHASEITSQGLHEGLLGKALPALPASN